MAMILPFESSRHRQRLGSISVHNGMWKCRRSIAGREIVFEAPSRAELEDAIQFTVNQRLTVLNVETCDQRAAPAGAFMRLIFKLTGNNRADHARRYPPMSLR